MNESVEIFNEEIRIEKAENVLFPIIAVLGLLTNAFVILIIVVSEKSRSNRTVANTFVLNLAIADILFLLALPFYTPSIHVNGYPFNEGMCKLLETTKHISYHASILFLTGMSFDRYIAIVHSLRSLEYRTQRNARIICAMLWITSIIVTTPIMAFSKIEDFGSNITGTVRICKQMFPGYETEYASERELLRQLEIYDTYLGSGDSYDGFNETMYYEDGNFMESMGTMHHTCAYEGHANSQVFKMWQWITFSAFFVLPVLVILFCYFKIWQATAIRRVRSQRAEEIQSKVTIMVAILVSGFIICWMPFQIWNIMTIPPGVKVSYAHQCRIIHSIVTLLAWSNSVLNPILYSITSENFRKRAMTTLFYMRYGYRRTVRMSMTRTSRTGIPMRAEKTDLTKDSPKYNRKGSKFEALPAHASPPPTPNNETGVSMAF